MGVDGEKLGNGEKLGVLREGAVGREGGEDVGTLRIVKIDIQEKIRFFLVKKV
jgi:hypothetical protein